MTYTPMPIDTGDVTVPNDLLSLVERLAEHVHDVFVQARMSEGWRYGERRDDTLKTNPTLVPYSDLPESEKEYDRKTAVETIKLIVKLGYAITKSHE